MGDVIFFSAVAIAILYGFISLAFRDKLPAKTDESNSDEPQIKPKTTRVRRFDDEFGKLSVDTSRKAGHIHMSDSE